MKDISVKDYCFIVIALCVLATTINRWNIGRFELSTPVETFEDGGSDYDFYVTDTKTGKVYELIGNDIIDFKAYRKLIGTD